MKTKLALMIVTLLTVPDVYAGLLFKYHQLALKDLDQMNAMVSSKVGESKKSSSGKTVPLKEALQAVLSRPNEDGMVEKVIGPLRSELEAEDVWEKTLRDLTQEAINALQNTRVFQADVQVTYAVFLENLLSELKPHANKEGFEKKMVEKIRDAKIELTKDAKKERQLRMMKSPVSPSEMADMILKIPPPEPKVEEKSEATTDVKPKTESK